MANINELIEKAQSLGDLEKALEELFQDHHRIDAQGRLYTTFVEVARFNGIRILINPREHAPPHFHVKGPGIDASFDIVTGTLLKGIVEPKYEQKIRWYYAESRAILISMWNQTRPADCPVGPITI